VADTIPFIWVLHVGIFVVWIPTILLFIYEQKQSKEVDASTPPTPPTPLDESKVKWLIRLIMVIAVYPGLNFMFFMTNSEGTVTNKDGVYSLDNRGKHIRDITEEEYHLYEANTLRGFSGHWILFYTVATIALYKMKSKNKEEN
jgi:hypothetical protein